MTRYVAFLRGVSPLNAKMPELARAFELASFTDVKTVLGSGNVLFSARAASEGSLIKKAEASMQKQLGRAFITQVRAVDDLRELLERDPFAKLRLAPGAKRIVTFLAEPPRAKLSLPIELEGVQVLARRGREVLSAHGPEHGPALMALLEKTFGRAITTRTWQTIERVSR